MDSPDGPHREENTSKEECEVPGLGAGVRTVCGATGERRKEKAIAQPTSSLPLFFKIRLLLLRKTFPSAVNFQPHRSRTGMHYFLSCCIRKKKPLALRHVRWVLGSSVQTKAELLGACSEARGQLGYRVSRGDRRGPAQDGAGGAKLWARLAINPFRDPTPRFSSLVYLSVKWGDGPALLVLHEVLVGGQ